MTETAPWWGVPVIAGSFLLLGGLLTFLFNYAIDGRKAKREARQRWDKEVLDLGCDLINVAQKIALEPEEYLFAGIEDDEPFPELYALWRLQARHPEYLTRLHIIGRNHIGDVGQAVLAEALREAWRRRKGQFDGESDHFMDVKTMFTENLYTQIGIEKEKATLIDRFENWRFVRKHGDSMTLELKRPDPAAGD